MSNRFPFSHSVDELFRTRQPQIKLICPPEKPLPNAVRDNHNRQLSSPSTLLTCLDYTADAQKADK